MFTAQEVRYTPFLSAPQLVGVPIPYRRLQQTDHTHPAIFLPFSGERGRLVAFQQPRKKSFRTWHRPSAS